MRNAAARSTTSEAGAAAKTTKGQWRDARRSGTARLQPEARLLANPVNDLRTDAETK